MVLKLEGTSSHLGGFSGPHPRNSDGEDHELEFLTSSRVVPMLMRTTDLNQWWVGWFACYRWENEIGGRWKGFAQSPTAARSKTRVKTRNPDLQSVPHCHQRLYRSNIIFSSTE